MGPWSRRRSKRWRCYCLLMDTVMMMMAVCCSSVLGVNGETTLPAGPGTHEPMTTAFNQTNQNTTTAIGKDSTTVEPNTELPLTTITVSKTDPQTTVARTDPLTTLAKPDPLTSVANTDPPTIATTDQPTTAAKTDPLTTAAKTDPLTIASKTDPLSIASKTDPPTTAAKTDPLTTVAKTDPPTTAAKTDPLTTVAKTDPLTTAAKTDPPTTAAKTDPPATAAKTDPPTTSAKTDPPTTTAKTDPLTTASKTDPPTTAAYTDPLTTAAKTDPPTTSAKTDPPTTAAKTDPLTTASKTDPPTTAAKTDPLTTAAKTDPPTTAAKTDPSTTAAKTDPLTTPSKTDPPTTAVKTYPPTTAAKTDPLTTVAKTDPLTTAAKTDPPTTAAKTDPPITAAKTDPLTTASKTDPPTTAAKTDPPTTAAKTDPPQTTIAKTDPPTTTAKVGLSTTMKSTMQEIQTTSQLVSTSSSKEPSPATAPPTVAITEGSDSITQSSSTSPSVDLPTSTSAAKTSTDKTPQTPPALPTPSSIASNLKTTTYNANKLSTSSSTTFSSTSTTSSTTTSTTITSASSPTTTTGASTSSGHAITTSGIVASTGHVPTTPSTKPVATQKLASTTNLPVDVTETRKDATSATRMIPDSTLNRESTKSTPLTTGLAVTAANQPEIILTTEKVSVTVIQSQTTPEPKSTITTVVPDIQTSTDTGKKETTPIVSTSAITTTKDIQGLDTIATLVSTKIPDNKDTLHTTTVVFDVQSPSTTHTIKQTVTASQLPDSSSFTTLKSTVPVTIAHTVSDPVTTVSTQNMKLTDIVISSTTVPVPSTSTTHETTAVQSPETKTVFSTPFLITQASAIISTTTTNTPTTHTSTTHADTTQSQGSHSTSITSSDTQDSSTQTSLHQTSAALAPTSMTQPITTSPLKNSATIHQSDTTSASTLLSTTNNVPTTTQANSKGSTTTSTITRSVTSTTLTSTASSMASTHTTQGVTNTKSPLYSATGITQRLGRTTPAETELKSKSQSTTETSPQQPSSNIQTTTDTATTVNNHYVSVSPTLTPINDFTPKSEVSAMESKSTKEGLLSNTEGPTSTATHSESSAHKIQDQTTSTLAAIIITETPLSTTASATEIDAPTTRRQTKTITTATTTLRPKPLPFTTSTTSTSISSSSSTMSSWTPVGFKSTSAKAFSTTKAMTQDLPKTSANSTNITSGENHFTTANYQNTLDISPLANSSATSKNSNTTDSSDFITSSNNPKTTELPKISNSIPTTVSATSESTTDSPIATDSKVTSPPVSTTDEILRATDFFGTSDSTLDTDSTLEVSTTEPSTVLTQLPTIMTTTAKPPLTVSNNRLASTTSSTSTTASSSTTGSQFSSPVAVQGTSSTKATNNSKQSQATTAIPGVANSTQGSVATDQTPTETPTTTEATAPTSVPTMTYETTTDTEMDSTNTAVMVTTLPPPKKTTLPPVMLTTLTTTTTLATTKKPTSTPTLTTSDSLTTLESNSIPDTTTLAENMLTTTDSNPAAATAGGKLTTNEVAKSQNGTATTGEINTANEMSTTAEGAYMSTVASTTVFTQSQTNVSSEITAEFNSEQKETSTLAESLIIVDDLATTTAATTAVPTTPTTTKPGLSSVNLTIDDTILKTNTEYNFTVEVKSYYRTTCSMDYGDNVTNHIETNPPIPALVFTHSYDDKSEGRVWIKVKCRDRLSEAEDGLWVETVRALKGFGLSARPRPVPIPPGLVTLSLNYSNHHYEGQAINMTWTFGDGQTERHELRANDTRDETFMVLHTYTFSATPLTASVVLYNKAGSFEVTTKVYMEQVITGARIVAIGSPKVDVGSQIRFLLILATGSQAELTVDFGDGTVTTVSAFNGTSVAHTYRAEDNYTVVARVHNAVSEMALSLPEKIIARRSLSDLVLKHDNHAALPLGKFLITISSTFDHMAVRCVFDMGRDVIERFFPLLSSGANVTLNYSYAGMEPGIYQMVVNCSNNVSVVTIHKEIIVVELIGSLSVSVTPNLTQIGDPVTINVTITRGSNITYITSYGDGVIENRGGVINNTVLFRYTYNTSGTFIIRASAVNFLSQASDQTTIYVVEPIAGATFNHHSTDLYSGRIYHGTGPDHNMFNVDRKLALTCNTTSGTNLMYFWELTEGRAKEFQTTKTPVLLKKYYKATNVSIKVTVTNGIMNVTQVMTVVLMEPAAIRSFTNNGPVQALKNLTFTLGVRNPTPSTCVLLKMYHETILQGAEVCKTIYALDSFVNQSYTYIGNPVVEEMKYVESYEKEGPISVDATVFNWVSRSFAVSQAAITRADCKYPLVQIFGKGQDVEAPQVTAVTEQVVVEAMVRVNCEFSNRVSYTWSLWKTVARGESIGKYNNSLINGSLSQDQSVLQPSVVFPPRYFIPDNLYNVSLSVIMLDLPEIATTDSFYIYVKSRPLEILFVSGNARAIGYNKDYTIDLKSRSRDPDAINQRNHSDWRFVWICYRDGEVEPHPDHGQLIEIPTQPVNISAFNDRGGCFGSGPGRLNLPINTSIVTFNSRNSPLHSFLIYAIHVTTPTKTKTAYQRIEITQGDPPEIIIRCMSNCQVKVNPNDTYAVLGRCLTCDAVGVTLTYNWTLYARNETTEEFHEVRDFYKMAPHTGTIGRSINIKEGELAPGHCYRIQLAGLSPYTATTYTQLDFCTTLPPFGGYCSVSPEVGVALETGFSVTCDRWINPETETSAGLKYQVWSQVMGMTDPPVLLSASPNPRVENLIFGPGVEAFNYTHQVSVIISHELGAYTNVYTSLRVEPLKMNADEMTSFMQSASENLMGLMSSGDSQKGFQKASAMGSMLNSAETKVDYSNMTAEELAAIARQQEEERKALRDNLINIVGSSKVYTLDAIQQSAGAISTVTKVSSEVSAESQVNTIGFMSDMAKTLTSFTVGNKGEPPSTKTTIAAAMGLIASVANAGKAAAESYRKTLTIASDLLAATNLSDWNATENYHQETTTEWFTTTTIQPTTQSIATTTILATTAAMVESSTILVRGVTTGMFAVTDTVAGAVLTNQVPGQKPVIIKSDVFDMLAGRELAESIGNKTTRTGAGGFKLPPVAALAGNKTPDFLDQKVLSMPENPFVWGGGADTLKSSVISLTLGDGKGRDLEIKDTEEDIIIEVEIDPANAPEMVEFSPFVRRDATWDTTHVITVENNNSAIYLILRPDCDNATYEVLLRYGERADDENYDLSYQIPRNLSEEEISDLTPELVDEMTYAIFVSSDFIEYYGSGSYYLRVKQHVNFSLETDYYMEDELPLTTLPPVPVEKPDDLFNMDDYVYPWYVEPPNPYDYVELCNYTLQTVTPICRYWNTQTETWDTDGCRVAPSTNSRTVRCACNHLTSFGSDFFVPPNTIDFASVYSDLGAKLKDNFAVLVTICVLLALYIIVAIWARYKDRQDVKKWGVTALADNLASEKYLYLLTVVTSMKGKAGTKSNISFVLTGDEEDTGVRKMSDGKRKEHSRGSSVQYVMSTENPLGHLRYLRIWHDNSGKKDSAGWCLDRFTVSDLQTGKTYAFIVNRWLAVDEDDGQIDRIIPVATPEDITAFRNLFVNTSKKNLTDGHLWVSIFVRPYKSTYTRVQRLSVVVSVTFLTMVVNAMFYKSEPVRTTRLELGFMSITTFQLWVSIMGTLIVIPPSIVMDQIFRKCRARPSKMDTVTQMVERAEAGRAGENDDPDDEDTGEDKKRKQKKKKSITFPWWFVFFGWLLVAGAIGVSAFMVFSYSIQWGKEKANSWLTAMLLSIFQSVLIVQPIKVFVIAAIIAIILKKPDVQDLDEEERRLNGEAAGDEELEVDRPRSGTREKVPVQPIDPKKLEKIRQKRIAEREMLTLIKEILIYIVYLMFLLFLAQQNRNSKAFLINRNLKNMFVDYDLESNEMFMKPEEVFGYLKDTFLPAVYWTEGFNGEEIGLRDKPFMADGVSFRVGAVRLRQVRIRPDECRIHKNMREIHNHCNVPYSLGKEDKGSYLPGWIPAKNKTQSANSPWVYRTMGQLKGAPHPGLLETYNGGGFVVDMSGPLHRIENIIKHLEENEWLDKYTRAVFLELAVLNAYVNLFTRLALAIEFSHTGLAFRSHQITTFQLYSYVGPEAVWIIFCEVMVLVFIIIFFVRIFKKIRKEGKKYLKSFWNSMELCKVILSIVAIVMYAIKNAYVKLSLGDIASREGEFMNFQRLALWNETFIYLISFVCFISILECLHLLRFNVKMSMLGRTLQNCSGQMVAFSVTFITAFLAFVQFAFLAFSPGMGIYKNFITAIESMLGHLLGDIDLVYMRDQYGWFGVNFYFVFIFVMTFIVLNMFFTILGDAFSTTKEEMANEKNQYELLNFVTGLVKDLLGMRSAAEIEAEMNADDENEETEVEEINIPKLEVSDADSGIDADADCNGYKRYDTPQIPIYVAPCTPIHAQASNELHSDIYLPGGTSVCVTEETQELANSSNEQHQLLTTIDSGDSPSETGMSVLKVTSTISTGDTTKIGPSCVPGEPAKGRVSPCKMITLETPPPATYLTPDEYDRAKAAIQKEVVVNQTPLPDSRTLYNASSSRPATMGSTKANKSGETASQPGTPRPITATRPIHLDIPNSLVSPTQVADLLSKLDNLENRLQDAVGTTAFDD